VNLKTRALQALIRKVMEEHVAFNKHIGLKIESFDLEAPKLRFDMRPELIGNPARQILHGGVISATLDVAGGFAIMLSLAAEMTGLPSDTLPSLRNIRANRTRSPALQQSVPPAGAIDRGRDHPGTRASSPAPPRWA